MEHDGRQATSMERMILGRTCLETYRLGFDGIPIQTVLGVRYLVKRMGMETFKKGPFLAAVDKGRNCTDCGDCMTRCPYELPIPELIRENLRWLDEELR